MAVSAMLFKFFVLAIFLLPVVISNLGSHSPSQFFHRAAGQARHALLSPVHVAQRIARDTQLAFTALSFRKPSPGPNLLAKRSQAPQCRLQAFPASPPSSRAPSHTSTPSSQPTTVPGQGNNGSTSPFRLVHSYSGNGFFNQWDFWDTGDPTHGVVDYLSKQDAQNAGLATINGAGNLVMRVDTTPQVSNLRKSVRITTQAIFNGGLLIMDALHMPTGCGTWPAFWTNGPNWPLEGEIDIVEGVNDYIDNQATVHTGHGCTLPSDFNTPTVFSQFASGQLVGGTNCAADETQNQGCGIRILNSTSFGPGFNSNGGGVYAMLWDSTGIAVFFFPRQIIPLDIVSENPNPSNWGVPNAKWPSGNCNPFEFFKDHVAIFDTTLCGDWAGGVWNNTGIPGQEQSCAQRTGQASCETFVLNNGGSFSEAYWEVSYVKLFQSD